MLSGSIYYVLYLHILRFYLVGQYFGSAVFRPQPDITPGVVWAVNEAIPVEVHTPPVEDMASILNTGIVNILIE